MTILKNYKLVIDPQETALIAQVVDRVPAFALDLETGGLDYNRAKIHGVSLATATQEWYVCLGAELAMLEHLETLVKDRLVLGHNVGYDMHFLQRHNVRLNRIFDTMIGQWLVDENQSLGLKELAYNRLGLPQLPDFKDLMHEAKRMLKKKRLEDVSVYDMPLEKLAEYGALDSRITYDLGLLTATNLKQEGLYDYFYDVEMPFVQVLVDMEETGFWLDQELLAKLKAEFEDVRNNALRTFLDIAGDINLNSPQQVSDYFYNQLGYPVTHTTDKGAPSVGILAVMGLAKKDKTGAAQALIDFRKHEKLLSTYIYPFIDGLFNGRLYGSFNHIGTVTGRLSSSEPNLQNIPAHGELGSQLREVFAVPAGYLFLDADYSQLELRLAMHFSQDPELKRIFEENLDPHQITADGIGVQRYIGKTMNYEWFYGAGPLTIADTIEEDGYPRPKLSQVKGWLNRFEQLYSGAARWKSTVLQRARQNGYVTTLSGRKRRLPDLNSYDKSLRGRAERQAVNAIIQGSAADLIKYAMLGTHSVQMSYDTRMNAQIHDELCAETPKDCGKEFAPLMKGWMIGAGEHYNLSLPLKVDYGLAGNWAEAKH